MDIATGPGKGEKSWAKPRSKFNERARFWRAQGLGLQDEAAPCNVNAVSVLSFSSQVEAGPPSVLRLERECLRFVVKGCGGLALPVDNS